MVRILQQPKQWVYTFNRVKDPFVFSRVVVFGITVFIRGSSLFMVRLSSFSVFEIKKSQATTDKYKSVNV